MFGKDLLIKSVVGMASSYFKKNPDKDIRVSVSQVVEYISNNYPDYKIRTEKTDNDIVLILSAKDGK